MSCNAHYYMHNFANYSKIRFIFYYTLYFSILSLNYDALFFTFFKIKNYIFAWLDKHIILLTLEKKKSIYSSFSNIGLSSSYGHIPYVIASKVLKVFVDTNSSKTIMFILIVFIFSSNFSAVIKRFSQIDFPVPLSSIVKIR